jgi:hypothetical protein
MAGPVLTMTWTGVNEVAKQLDLTNKKAILGFVRGLKAAGEWLLAKSQEIVPWQFGKLSGSGYVRNIGGQGLDANIVVGYQAAHAVYVHENLEAAHGQAFNVKYANQIAAHSRTIKRGARKGQVTPPTVKSGWSPRGVNQQAKFLETPMRTEREAMMDIIYREAIFHG